MAQKVNSLNLRLNKRLNWNSIFCVHNINDYSNKRKNTSAILDVNSSILYNLQIMQNATIITKTSKNYKLNVKNLNQIVYFYLFKLVCSSKKTLQNFINYKQAYLQIFKSTLKLLLIKDSQIISRLTNIDLQENLWKYKMFQSKFLTFYPKLLTEFAKQQLATTNNTPFTSTNFNKNLQKNLLKLIEIVLKKYPYKIIGVKLICSGKWRKTPSGRKQKVYLKFGQIQTSNLANKIVYHNVSQRTKFGICSIKLWIAHKL